MNRYPLLFCIVLIVLDGCLQETKNERTNGVTNLFPIREFKKWGYISAEGKTIIECQFDTAREFSEGLAAVMVDSLWGFIDTTGKMVISPAFYEVYNFSDGLCNVHIKTDSEIKNSFIKNDGSIAFTSQYSFISSFSDGRATVTIDDEVCVINKAGEIVFNTHYPYGGGKPLQDGIVQVWGGKGRWVQEGNSTLWRGDTTRYFNKDGKLLLELEGMGYSNFNKGLALVRIKDESCYINIKGEVKIKPERPELTYFPFSEGLAEAVISGSSAQGFIDTTGRIVIPMEFDLIQEFHEGLAAFNDNGSWGFIDKTGRVVIEPQFEQAGTFDNGLCYVSQRGRWGYIDVNGEFVWREPKSSSDN